MLLQKSTWPEVEGYLGQSVGVIVPIGATEQHGPTGPLGTDAVVAEIVGRRIGDLTEALVAPTLSIGMSEHHMKFPGTITFRPSTLVLVVYDAVVSLARHGFRRFFFVNGHGGNTPSLTAAFSEVYGDRRRWFADSPDLRCEVISWWECAAAEKRSKELFDVRDGEHATPSELSIAAEYFAVDPPESAPFESIPEFTGIFGCEDFRLRYPDGRIGSDPSMASREIGRLLVEEVAADLAERYREFLRAE